MTAFRRLLACVLAAALPARALAGPSACTRLAAEARGLPPGAWAEGSKALSPWLKINEAEAPKGGFAAELARNPAVRKATANPDGNWTTFVDHLAGTDLYLASTSQGTLHCQTSAFIRARPGHAPRFIAAPRGAGQGEGDAPCWTRVGALGRVYGQPAYFEHGANDQTTDDEDIQVTPWTGQGWGRTCTVKLRYTPRFAATDRRCRDAAACAALAPVVGAIAEAHRRWTGIQKDPQPPFRFGPAAGPAAVKLAEAAPGADNHVPNWPGFGPRPDERPVSYSNLAYFPLRTGGRDYVAAIGHEGVGWREGPTTLLVIYAIGQDGKLTEAAAYAVDRGIEGLASVSAD